MRDKYILYKNPRNFSHIENTVTIATVLKNLLKNVHPLNYNYRPLSILFAKNPKYNMGMKKFFYRVKKGDTVLKLSDTFSLPPTKIVKLNNLKSEILEGDLLYLETDNRTVYTVSLTDTLNSIATKFNTTPEKILNDNGVPYLFYSLKILV